MDHRPKTWDLTTGLDRRRAENSMQRILAQTEKQETAVIHRWLKLAAELFDREPKAEDEQR